MKITEEADFARAEALFTLRRMRTDTLSIPFWSPEEIEAAHRARRSSRSSAATCSRIPTETVYGFGGGIDRESVDALVALKSRPPGKPFLLLIVGTGHDRAARPASAERTRANLVARHWPGPLTLVLAGR